jgi:integrase
MASIRRLYAPGQDRKDPEVKPAGLWQVLYRDEHNRQRGQSYATEKDAKRFKAKVETQLAEDDYIDPSSGEILFGDWIRLWQKSRVVSRTTAANEASLVKNHVRPAFENVRLRSITKMRVQGWVAELGQKLAPASVSKAYRVLQLVMDAAVDEGLIRLSPCRGITLPRADVDERVFLTPEQVGGLVAQVHERYRALLVVAYLTGMRWSELAGLRVKRLDLLRARLDVAEVAQEVSGKITFGPPKTKSSRRVISLPPEAVDVLAKHLATWPVGRDGLVFRSARGHPLSRTIFRARVWIPALEKAGLVDVGPTFHSLRHSHAASLIADRQPLLAVTKRLGHSSMRVTYDLYGHLEESVETELLEGLGRRARIVLPPAAGDE